MDMIADILTGFVAQMQKPTLAFLIGGMVLAACGSKLEIPEPVYKFIVFLLLMKVGLGAGISVREANLFELAVPAVAAAMVGIAIVLFGGQTLARLRGVTQMDAMATAGLFGAVSASTLAAGMAMLDEEGIAYEGFIGALYPFMDIAALVTAIVLARLSAERKAAAQISTQPGGAAVLAGGGGHGAGNAQMVRGILVDTFRSAAISALLLGLALGILARPDSVYESFYDILFRGLLSILMLIMGMEAWSRLSELRRVAHAYVAYGLLAPLVHGALGFAAGLLVHQMTGFSGGGVVLLAVMAASSSDISGPPTLRGALPEANPSAYVGTSTGLGTPVAILSIPLWIVLADMLIGV
ncbi:MULTISPECIES: sodium-dependent bicarbonate transport family permease [Rhodobacterales]|uniref:Sodium-dependent bicarbonate transport family permease n=1 Tax=Marivita cryptomonadis TaxID=505252 RepID=A0A9Q2NWL1_9RHOB|nr:MULTISPECIES: sodium-dependent bicarbonate transport family permease [Rhodobacterales]MCR9170717.1 sodium-dependent bicarbonate transport family permease [Paracoccaceae bacterium]MBM2324286.1 sodium-dependent bicarbonate transport family permease [Marivita cryptomonadis]MBM2333883.1 sodium-dependent bicarbonate transport family permease [Marivita cryptomonadis]MBM2343443.1 sodium-dependent bicarbonate transport family permease [Marivita cryptomonadis]MBM2348126.1 sodium-dependent bicarbonat